MNGDVAVVSSTCVSVQPFASPSLKQVEMKYGIDQLPEALNAPPFWMKREVLYPRYHANR